MFSEDSLFGAGFFTCLFIVIIGCAIVLNKSDIAPQGTNAMIEECEKHLPRTQTCELVAAPKEVEGE